MSHKVVRISSTIRVYMKWNPTQHPSLYYDANTHIPPRNSGIIILMVPSTEKSHLDGTVAYDENKT